AGRSDLPLLPEQSDRRGADPRGAEDLDRLRARAGRRHPLRRRVRGVHPRRGNPALDLRDRGRARGRDRVSLLLEDRRVHGHAVRTAPYIWVRTSGRLSSWDFFAKLLHEAHVVGTPGAGFGPSGEGYFRLTAFGGRAATEEAVDRIKTRLTR